MAKDWQGQDERGKGIAGHGAAEEWHFNAMELSSGELQ